MSENIARILLIVLLGLLAGTMFGIWVGFNPLQLAAAAYVEQQQTAIRSLNTLLPAIGAVCILLAAYLAVRSKRDPRARNLWAAAVLLLLAAAVITRFGNQPINAIVVTWSAQSPPSDWAALREQWWQWHIVRTIAAVIAFALSAIAAVSPSSSRRSMDGRDP